MDGNFPSALRWSPGGDALYFQDTGEVDGTDGVTRSDGDAGNGTCDTLWGPAELRIFTGVSPDESVYVTVDHGDVDVSSAI